MKTIDELVNLLKKLLNHSPAENKKYRNAFETNNRILLFFVFVGSVLGGSAILVYAWQAGKSGLSGLSIFSVSIAIAGASFLIGSLTGFLFGIPRVLQNLPPATPKTTGADTDKDKTGRSSYSPNTNLEQISDWLTKILVGAGLVQLSSLHEKVGQLAVVIGPAIGPHKSDQVFAGSIFIFFLIFGFLLCYLWTRLFLQPALAEDSLTELTDKVRQSELDAKALAIVEKQLDRGFDAKGVDEKELVEAIKNSSDYMKAQIFSKAQTVRAMNWRDPATKPIMERTIPVFRALIAVDTGNIYHRNHAELGYVLKDQSVQDYSEAEKELTKAIDMRGNWKTNGWVLYEFNRAICRIKSDPSIKQQSPSTPEAKDKILGDLKAAASSEQVKGILLKDNDIKKWMELNGVDPSSL